MVHDLGKDTRRTEERHERKFAALFAGYMANDVEAFIRSSEAPALISYYSQDATECQARETHKVGSKIKRPNKRFELLTERYFCSDGRKVVTCFTDGRTLERKRGCDLYSCRAEFPVGLIRLHGYTGYVIEVYVTDRGARADLALRGYFLLGHRLPFAEGQAEQCLEVKEWPVYVGCSVHDIHNSAKKAAEHAMGRDITSFADALFAASAAMASSSSAIYSVFEVVISENLRYYNSDSEHYPAADIATFLSFCGLDEVTSRAAIVLGLFFRDGRWYVDEIFQVNSEEVELAVARIVGECLEVQKATFTRRLSIRHACQKMLLAKFFGVDKVVERAKQVANAQYDLIPFERSLSPEFVPNCVTVAASMQPFDKLLTKMLIDDRMGNLIQARDELREVTNNFDGSLLMSVATVMPALHGEYDRDYMAKTIVADVSNGIVAGRTYSELVLFSQLSGYPWKLVAFQQGTPQEMEEKVWTNLMELERTEEHTLTDITTKKIRYCFRRASLSHDGREQQRICTALLLLRTVPLAVLLVENAHATHARMNKSHPKWSQESLIRRGFLQFFKEALSTREAHTRAQIVREKREISRFVFSSKCFMITDSDADFLRCGNLS